MSDSSTIQPGPRLEQIIHLIRLRMDEKYPRSLLGIWSSEPNVIRVVYRAQNSPPEDFQVYGLVREIEPDVPLQLIVEEMVDREIGEPLGTLAEGLWLEAGVLWFRGNRPDWRLYPSPAES